jgi:phosphoribosylamine--glycine ligase
MKVLIIGRGGREHALAWKISQSSYVSGIFVAPGNDGMRDVAETVAISETDFENLVRFVENNEIDLTVVGPEVPLALGIVDYFKERGLKIFGPTQQAAQIESSKIYAKQLMKKYRIPTAGFYTASSLDEARKIIQSLPFHEMVIKADGLAAGKGVVICSSKEEAQSVVNEFLIGHKFGKAGEKIVIEERLFGEEASVFALTDGENFVILPASQDHKAVFDGDTGPNTGGMGAYAPTPLINEQMMDRIRSEIIQPTLSAMRKEGTPFQGCLYCGLMITDEGPKVIEFNCRFGDPETEVVLPVIESDLLPVLHEIAEGNLTIHSVQQKDQFAVSVVLASGGYPGQYRKGVEIAGLDHPMLKNEYLIFHAGTKIEDGKFVTNGGRVLNVVGKGTSLREAIQKTYEGVKLISFDQMHFRKDIGQKGLKYGE